MHTIKITGGGFCDIRNNQSRGRGYQPKAEAKNPYREFDYPGYHKKPNLKTVSLYMEPKYHVCASSLTVSSTKRANIDMSFFRNHAPRSYICDLECP